MCWSTGGIFLVTVMGGESWCSIKKILSPIPSSQGWACGTSACTYIIMYLFFYDVIGLCLIFIFYEFYLFIFFYIDRVYLTTFCLLIFLSC